MEITFDVLKKLVDGPVEGVEVLDRHKTLSSRDWLSRYILTFKHEDKMYKTSAFSEEDTEIEYNEINDSDLDIILNEAEARRKLHAKFIEESKNRKKFPTT